MTLSQVLEVVFLSAKISPVCVWGGGGVTSVNHGDPLNKQLLDK